jgi:hypothetical protein
MEEIPVKTRSMENTEGASSETQTQDETSWSFSCKLMHNSWNLGDYSWSKGSKHCQRKWQGCEKLKVALGSSFEKALRKTAAMPP